MKARRRISLRDRNRLKFVDPSRIQKNLRIRRAALERDRLKSLLSDTLNLSDKARTDIEAALAKAQANFELICADPLAPVNLGIEQNADLGKRAGDRVDPEEVETEHTQPFNGGKSDQPNDDSVEDEIDSKIPLTKKHVGAGRWWVMRGEENVAGPFKKEEIDAALAAEQEKDSKPIEDES